MLTAAEPGAAGSLTGRQWVWRGAEDRLGLALAQRLGVPEVVGRLLAGRGVGVAGAADFLEPTLRALLPDPSVLADMDVAAGRLARAVRAGECVAVFGDYDVDGACSAAIVALLLRGLGCVVRTHVPDRLLEGYGPNAAALRGLAAAGASLIVCVDCGTAAGDILDGVAGLAEVVVLDHHKFEGAPPRVVATVNPNRPDDGSGLGGLCAAAIAFLAAVAVVRVLRREGFFDTRAAPDLLGLLDLVALATVCDVMPLVGLNRALVTQGLKVMGRRARPGVAALLAVAGGQEAPSAFTCGFALGPRINAAGRIGEAGLGLALLLCEDAGEAASIAARLDGVNRERQGVEAAMHDAAMAAAEAQVAAGHAAILVVQPGWHPGVVGIMAGRLKERFNRPACVGGVVDGAGGPVVKGSGRSVPGLDIGAAVIAARQAGLLLTSGGHAMAAGFNCAPDAVPAFHAFLDARLAGAASLPAAAALVVEASVSVAGATLALARAVGRLAPFGMGNEDPVLVLPRARVVRADRCGRENTALRVLVEGEGGGRLRAMLFRAREGSREGALARVLEGCRGEPVHLAGHLRAEHWNGEDRVGFVIVDAAAA